MMFRCVRTAVLLGAVLLPPSAYAQGMPYYPPRRIAPPNDLGKQFTAAQIRSQDAETDGLLRLATARSQFSVDGSGLAIAVLDSGLRTTHVDFRGKIVARRNFTTESGGDPNIVDDGNGHGTNVAGIAVARGIHTGIAPGANLVPLKVLKTDGSGSFESVEAALAWVLANARTYKISVVNLSLGDGSNTTTDNVLNDGIRTKIQQLRTQRIAVVCAAGNDFYRYTSRQGMSYPGILRETISVGALYDASLGRVDYGDGAIAYTTGAGRFCPFSQRLHPNVNAATRTDVFVPGAALTSAGIANDNAESTYHGTSQATPVAAGLVLLAQQYALRRSGQLPTVDQLEKWLRAPTSRTQRLDGDDENDNVSNTNLSFASADAIDLLTAAKTELDAATPPAPTTTNVTAVYDAARSTLTLTGDSGANVLTLQAVGTTVKITAGTGTTVNGASTVSYNVPRLTSLVVTANMNAGNDNISFVSLPAGALMINLHDGNDTVTLSYCNVTTLAVDGGGGTDVLTTTSSTIRNRQVKNVP
ncbi:MAG TPA: S8 family serine peptidase [Planctomycetaceae bacterium]|nr:S8 family serine peptidase [Planctomycetaceae bacterium]